MIPQPAATLADLAMRISTHIGPATTDNFAQADCGLITGLLLAMAQDVERAVDNRMQDLAQMKASSSRLLATPRVQQHASPSPPVNPPHITCATSTHCMMRP